MPERKNEGLNEGPNAEDPPVAALVRGLEAKDISEGVEAIRHPRTQ